MKKSRKLIVSILLAIIILIIPKFAPNLYILQIINMVGIYIILAIGVNILTGYSGQLSFGQAAFYGIGAYTAALLNRNLGLPFLVVLPIAIVITAIFGVVLAIPAIKLRGPYLALITIAFGEVVRIVMVNWKEVTRGTAGVVGIDPPVIFGYKFDNLVSYYYLILLFVLIGMLYQNILIKSRTGRAFIAIREDTQAAELTGINVVSYKITAFVISAVYSAIAGVLYAMMIRYISPDSFTSNDSSVIVWTAMVGGMGTLIGPILGGIIMTILPEALRSLADLRLVIYGLILMVVIIKYPGGLAPYLPKLKSFIKTKIFRKSEETQH
jgi:branched-chain amino acid transport system permease protein